MMTTQTSTQWRLTGAAALATLLTSLCLTPTLAEGSWGLHVLAMVTSVAVVGGLLRQWSTPAILIPLVQAATLFVVAALLFARDANAYGVLPTPETLSTMLSLGSDATSPIWNEQPPVTVTAAVSLVVSLGVGAIAVLVDALAVTWRKPTLAGLPLFALYLVPAAVLPGGVPWPLFTVAGAGWILIQLADGRERLAHWGRAVDVGGKVSASPGALTSTGRRLGVTALVAAVAIPMMMPSIGEGVFGGGGTSEGGDADKQPASQANSATNVVTVNPLVDLKRDITRPDDQEVFRYITTDTSPEYWRLATLDQFDGYSWTLAESSAPESQQAAAGLPNPPGLTDDILRQVQVSEVEVTALNSKRLPLPYPTMRVEVDGDWRWDSDTFDVFSASVDDNAFGMTYIADSLDLSPTTEQLQSAPEPGPELDTYLQVPQEVTDLLLPTTDEVLAGETNDLVQAQLIQNWFRTEFDYSLDTVAGNETSDLAAFLDDRSGYCEQFAATMALMARVAGVPSRVQVGFTPGSQGADGSWEVSSHDAHAWPELWFQGAGWVRFEPTPGGGEGNGTPAWAPAPVSERETPRGNQRGESTPQLRRGNSPQRPEAARDLALARIDRSGQGVYGSAAPDEATSPGPDRRWLLLFVLGVASLAAAAPGVTRRLTVARRWRHVTTEGQAIQAAWEDVLGTATDLDLAPDLTQTPRDLAVSLPHAGGLSHANTKEWQRLCQAIEMQRYAEQQFPSSDGSRIQAWRERGGSLSDALLGAVAPRDRRIARWWPASGRRDLTLGWNQAMDAVGTRWQTSMSGLARRLRRS